MKIKVCPFQILVSKENKKPSIRINCLDENGERIKLFDDSFKPSFYVLVEGNSERIESVISSSLGEGIKEFKVENKIYLGEDKRFYRIYFDFNEDKDVQSAKFFKKFREFTLFHHDLRPTVQYILEKNITFCSFNEVEVDKSSDAYRVEGNFSFFSYDYPDFRSMSFYFLTDSKVLNPDPEINKIIYISIFSNEGPITFEGDEKDIFEGFLTFVKRYKPSIIYTFNVGQDDFDFMTKRAKNLGLNLKFEDSTPTKGQFGFIQIDSIVIFDLFQYAQTLYDLKQKELKKVLEFLNIASQKDYILDQIELVKAIEVLDAERLSRHCKYSAKSIFDLGELTHQLYFSLSQITFMPLDVVIFAPTGFRVEGLFMKKSYLQNMIVLPKKRHLSDSYEGGIVLRTSPGVYKDVVVLDFKSMLPSIMIRYNISFDTFVEEGCDEECFKSPKNAYKFRKSPDGFYKKILQELIFERDRIKKSMDNFPKSSKEYIFLNAKQKTLKIITNACYGYAGWQSARWFKKEIAEATSEWGRKTLIDAIDLATSLGLEIIYGDTDSLFVKESENISKFLSELKLKGEIIKVDEVFRSIVFTEAKKKYAGINDSGELVLVGFEGVHGDVPEIVRIVQERILRSILNFEGFDAAIEILQGEIEKLRKNEYPLLSFVIYKAVNKNISSYEVKAPHVEAAKKYIQMGFKLRSDNIIGYVITKGTGAINSRALPYIYLRVEDVDIDYYIKNLLVPSVSRILYSVFGKKVVFKNDKLIVEGDKKDYLFN
ncbi:DNA polymerase B region [Thermodesulfobium narugense DSM 14796]|uniref:DNA polymerase n=1 Tax=Thermodesulfobium narugense DSM 14796 TaxID=747365 RepID=M1E6B7_9BACT|nr:DNA-directed DNA polymerase [Thermodesulfobium narugense]AEE14083.1 DNA polymerase B region [Thermodesulfobium narugense DSM 14796]